jgi:hypothetical protein
MDDDNLLPFSLPAVARKKLTAAFDGGRLTSDGGVLLLAAVERRMQIAERLAGEIADPRAAALVVHTVADILRARMLAIACGWEDADDLDRLRTDPAFKLACGRLPDTGDDLCSQPTVSRWENAPGLREVVRLMRVMVDLYCASYATPPATVILDIDDTVDVVHGHQQLSLFNAHYDERCFLPIHVYDTATSRPVAVLLRPGKTPSGREVRGHLRRLVRQIRRHWPATRLTIRGDGHYGRPEVMAWCEDNGIDYVSVSPATTCCAPPSRPPPTMSACVVQRLRRRCCGATARHAIGPSHGQRIAGLRRASKPARSASTSASSSPASPPVAPSGSTTPFTVPAARLKT